MTDSSSATISHQPSSVAHEHDGSATIDSVECSNLCGGISVQNKADETVSDVKDTLSKQPSTQILLPSTHTLIEIKVFAEICFVRNRELFVNRNRLIQVISFFLIAFGLFVLFEFETFQSTSYIIILKIVLHLILFSSYTRVSILEILFVELFLFYSILTKNYWALKSILLLRNSSNNSSSCFLRPG